MNCEHKRITNFKRKRVCLDCLIEIRGNLEIVPTQNKPKIKGRKQAKAPKPKG